MYIHKRATNLDNLNVTHSLIGTPSEKGNCNLYKCFSILDKCSIDYILTSLVRSSRESTLDYLNLEEAKSFILKALTIGNTPERTHVIQKLSNIIEEIQLNTDLLPGNIYEYVCVDDDAFAYLSLKVKQKSSYFGFVKYNAIRAKIRQGTF